MIGKKCEVTKIMHSKLFWTTLVGKDYKKCYGQNACNPFFHNCYFPTPDIGFSHQYEVLWLLCPGRLVSKADNVMYTNAHTFCWLQNYQNWVFWIILDHFGGKDGGKMWNDQKLGVLYDFISLVWEKIGKSVKWPKLRILNHCGPLWWEKIGKSVKWSKLSIPNC